VSGALIDVFGVGWAFAGFGVLQVVSGWCAVRARPGTAAPDGAAPASQRGTPTRTRAPAKEDGTPTGTRAQVPASEGGTPTGIRPPADEKPTTATSGRAETAGGSHPRPRRLREEISEGMRYVLGGQPLRALALANLVIGLISAATAVLVPAVAEGELGQGAFAASLLVSALTPGMLLTTLILASRPTVPHQGLLFFIGLFSVVPMMVMVGLSRSYALSLAAVLFWGMPIGLFVVLVRQLAQANAEAAMIGRVMGVLHVLSRGSLPIASFGLLLLTRSVSAGTALALTGLVVAVIAAWTLTTAELRRA
jgi:hypothetical protein